MTLSESLILDMYDDGDDDYPSSVERPSSAEPNVSNEPPHQPKATLQRSLSFVNLLNPADGPNRSRPKSTLLTSIQTRSKSQTFLPACSFSRLDDPCDATSAEGTETKTNYLSIPKALASVSGMFRELPSPGDDLEPSDLDVIELDYDPHRTRLNQRRLIRGERRYYTADTIQDMKAKKPAPSSLHKHRSWNCAGDGRAFQAVRSWPSSSSDSVQSILSSSGVSSSGSSLRMSRDSEICEETESELLEADSIFKIEGAISEDEQDLAEDDGTACLDEEDTRLPPSLTRPYTKSKTIGTQTMPDVAVGDLPTSLHTVSSCTGRCGQVLRGSSLFSRSMPNIALLCNGADDSRMPNGTTRIRRRQISPAQVLRTQPWTTTVKIS